MSDVDSGYRERLTIEELAADCLDVRELHRAGYLDPAFRSALAGVSLAQNRADLLWARLDPDRIRQPSHPSANPHLVDALSLRRQQTLDALPPLQTSSGSAV